MTDLLSARARSARQARLFFAGQSDKHPHGWSGLRFLLPYVNDRRMNDGGEWARAAGFE